MGGGRAFFTRKTSTAGDKRRRWPWSELPPSNPFTHLPPSLETEMWCKNYRNAPATTKSRLPTTTRCSNNAYQRPQILHVTTERDSNLLVPVRRDPPSQFLGDSAFDLQAMHESKNKSYWCVLRVDSTPETIRKPTYDRFDNLEPRMGPTSGLVVHREVSGQTGGYTSYKYVSIRHECTTVDPFDPKKKLIEFTASIIQFQGKFFAISFQGTLVVMETIDNRLKITGVSAVRAIPSSDWRFFKEYLIETNEEILLLFLIYEKSLAVVDRVEVFRLDLVKLGWIRVERLGGKTMFLKEKCICVDSAEFGWRDNCVYFDHKPDGSWKVYDMKNGGISTF